LEHVIFIVIIVGFERRGGVCVGGWLLLLCYI